MKFKNISLLVSLVFAMALSASRVSAEVSSKETVPSDMSVLASKDALRTMLLGKIRTIRTGAGAASQIAPVADQAMSVNEGVTAAALGPLVDSIAKFQVSYVNPKDSVWIWANATDAAGNTLFNGANSAQAVANSSSYVLPLIKNELWMSWNVPIAVGTDVVSAEMVVVHPINKWTNATVRFEVRDGQVAFETDLAGKGILILTTKSGAKVSYDLTNQGVKVDPLLVSATSNTSVRGIVSLKDVTVIDRMFASNQGVGESSAFEVVLTSAATIRAAAYTSEGAVPLGYWVRRAGEDAWAWSKLDQGKLYASVALSAGTYYIVAKWDPSTFREFDPYVDGSGKGG